MRELNLHQTWCKTYGVDADRLNNPQLNIRGIHVGGTNGKGSTVAYIRAALVENGYEVGTFTSPFIETFNERISLNGLPLQMTRLLN